MQRCPIFLLSDDDHTGRLSEIEGLQLIVPKHFFYGQTATGHHAGKVVECEPGNFFDVFEGVGRLLVYYPDFFIKVGVIIPSGKVKGDAIDYFFRPVHQVLCRIVAVEIIEHKDPVSFEGKTGGMYRLIMLALSPEITKTGEEIECVVEAIGAKGPAHVMNIKIEVVVAELAGVGYTGRRQVDACYIITPGCQDARIPARRAVAYTGACDHSVSLLPQAAGFGRSHRSLGAVRMPQSETPCTIRAGSGRAHRSAVATIKGARGNAYASHRLLVRTMSCTLRQLGVI